MIQCLNNDRYPIGTIIHSYTCNTEALVISTYGGVAWTQITNRFLYGSILAGTTGGANSVSYTPSGAVGNTTLTVDQIPSHDHVIPRNSVGITSGGTWIVQVGGTDVNQLTQKRGGGKAHNHGFTGTAATINTIPQYYTCYIWRRVS